MGYITADDPARLIESLDLRDAILVGHSTGGGKAVRYSGRHHTERVATTVLPGVVPPLMLENGRQPRRAAHRGVRRHPRGRRRRPLTVLPGAGEPFCGFNRPGAEGSDGMRRAFPVSGTRR
ncbi:alpha/beta fold hydrolase [Streptomyces viridosporus]|uniref:alpha/beta fold hydrolase n=1 Tax=Streptomyces viridosporus TaxID=67581 RepID=UPI003D9DD869